MFICGDERQIENFSGRCEKVVGGITVRKIDRRDGERNFNRQGRLDELQVQHGFSDPGSNIEGQLHPPLAGAARPIPLH